MGSLEKRRWDLVMPKDFLAFPDSTSRLFCRLHNSADSVQNTILNALKDVATNRGPVITQKGFSHCHYYLRDCGYQLRKCLQKACYQLANDLNTFHEYFWQVLAYRGNILDHKLCGCCYECWKVLNDTIDEVQDNVHPGIEYRWKVVQYSNSKLCYCFHCYS